MSPSTCQAWQQFVYTTDSNIVFMQYWLIDYNTTCPSGWFTYSTDCYTNSAESTLSGPALGSESSPTMASKQTDGAAGTKSCAVAS